MDRLACLELPALALQIALREHPDSRAEPAAIVDRDAPHGLVRCANRAARAAGVLPGQRYAAALGLCPRLRAFELAQEAIDGAVAMLLQELHRHSPEVEPHADEPGVFWISGRGLERLFGTPRAWGERILAHVRGLGFEAKLAVGFRRFATYACARGLDDCGLEVLDDPADEARTAARVPLARLAIDPEVRDALAKLAVVTLRDFARLPPAGILRRFGESAYHLHRSSCGALEEDLAPAPEHIPFAAHVDLDFPLDDVEAIVTHAGELLRSSCETLDRRGEAASAIALRFDLDDRTRIEEHIRPAWASCDVPWLVRLVRMRLEGLVLPCGVVRIEVELAHRPRSAEQSALLLQATTRPPRAAQRAFSALRALFGEDAVVRARLVSAHLPECSFHWERLDDVAAPRPRVSLAPPLVRCLLEKPAVLPPRSRHEPDGWLLRGVVHGPVAKLFGPYRLSGGWWRAEVKREYYFAELATGEIDWIFYDAARRRWFLQGAVS